MTRLAALAVLCLLAGCGGSAAKAPAHVPHVTVVIRNYSYGPAALTVRAGTRVTWRNESSSPHTATARGGGFTTHVVEQGQARTLTLTRPGRFTYTCIFHPFMHGTLVVAR